MLEGSQQGKIPGPKSLPARHALSALGLLFGRLILLEHIDAQCQLPLPLAVDLIQARELQHMQWIV